MGIMKKMNQKTKQKLSQLLTRITSPPSLNLSMTLNSEIVGVSSAPISQISLQKLASRRKNTRRWQSKLLYLDRLGLDDPKLIGKKSL